MNIVVDTCIIIDALQQRKPFDEDAKALCLAVANQKCNAYIPAKSVADIYYILHRFLHNDSKTKDILKILFRSFNILDTTAYDCRNALSSNITDFEDAILVETSIRNNIDFIVTRNLKDYKNSEVPACLPSEFLARINGD